MPEMTKILQNEDNSLGEYKVEVYTGKWLHAIASHTKQVDVEGVMKNAVLAVGTAADLSDSREEQGIDLPAVVDGSQIILLALSVGTNKTAEKQSMAAVTYSHETDKWNAVVVEWTPAQ